MGPFTKAALGAFVGRLLVTLFVAICVALGVGPDRWAAFVLGDLYVSIGPFLARIGFVILAAVTFGFLAWPVFRKRLWGAGQRADDGQATGIAVNDVADEPEESVYMTAGETLHYMVEQSDWGKRIRLERTERGGRQMPFLAAIGEHQRQSQEGNIRASGRLNGAGPHIAIPAEHWITSVIDLLSALEGPIGKTAPAVPDRTGIPIYTDLRIIRANVYERWPRRATG